MNANEADRFHPAVHAALVSAGWHPGRRSPRDTLAAIHAEVRQRRGLFGATLTSNPAADAILEEFGGLVVAAEPAGTSSLAPRPFALDPTLARYAPRTLTDLGRVLGTAVYPIGVEGLDDGILAVNALGQVFAVDAVGDWYLGGSIEEALATLVTGRVPVRVGDDGSWPGRVWHTGSTDPSDVVPIGSEKRPIGAAFFLPRTTANLHEVWLPDTLVRIGTVPHAGYAPGRLGVDWGEASCEAHVLDLDEFTVLVLSFEQSEFLRQREDAGEDDELVDQTPIAQAFASACTALSPDLEVAFVQTRLEHNLLEFVAGFEFDVLTLDSMSLLSAGLPLLYLRDSAALELEDVMRREGRDELPVPGGRLIFRGTGGDRW